MAKHLFDTNIVSARSLIRLPPNAFMSAVVLSELMAAGDKTEFEAYQIIWRRGEKDNTLIVPTVEDWLPAARILHLLALARKKKSGGKAPRRTPTAKQELAMDVLIAVSAARAGVTVVTNDTDFDAIRYYHKQLKVKRGDEFFGEG